ncbi:MAG: hypothetical protein KME30_33460 [Iphinoe sp. HA4291-MV1]|jgi:hypothetical protein|nr:hypothetical protein [Iphinoe sp. HA4291-MV1]
MEKQKTILSNLIVNLFIIGASVIAIFITFHTGTKQVSANFFTIKLLVANHNYLKSTEEDFAGELSTQAIDLLETSENNRFNIEFIKYQNADIEIGERSCSLASAQWHIKFGSTILNTGVFAYLYLADVPLNTAIFSVFTPTIRKETVNLESKETIFSSLNENCNSLINITKEHDSFLLIHKPARNLELERNIQNSWPILNRK